MPIQKDDLDALLAEVYPDGQRPTTLQDANLHRLSLLFMVFAIGALFDIERPLCPSEAEEYHSLARAALCGEQIFNNTTLDCVQSMVSFFPASVSSRRLMRTFLVVNGVVHENVCMSRLVIVWSRDSIMQH
jgi:hypothetical protein